MGKALGLSERGNALPRFLASQSMKDALGAQLKEKLKNPLKFQRGTPGAPEGASGNVHGFDAAVLIELCQAIIKADSIGKLDPQQKKIATNAAIIVGASAKSGIRDLVYALAGFDQTADQVIQAFKVYVQEEARKYEPEFPVTLYELLGYAKQHIPEINLRHWTRSAIL